MVNVQVTSRPQFSGDVSGANRYGRVAREIPVEDGSGDEFVEADGGRDDDGDRPMPPIPGLPHHQSFSSHQPPPPAPPTLMFHTARDRFGPVVPPSSSATYNGHGDDDGDGRGGIKDPTVETSGTLGGSLLPVLRGLFGVMLYLRMPLIVAHGGVTGACIVVLVAVVSTLLTGACVSAMANSYGGRPLRVGSPHHLFARVLGLEMGGLVSCILFLGLCVGAGLSVLGAVEAIRGTEITFPKQLIRKEMDDYRLLGFIVMAIMAMLLAAGSRFAGRVLTVPLVLVVVLSGAAVTVGYARHDGYRASLKSEAVSQCVYTDTGLVFTFPSFTVNVTDLGTNKTALYQWLNQTMPSATPLPDPQPNVIDRPPPVLDTANSVSAASTPKDPMGNILPWFNTTTPLHREPFWFITCARMNKAVLRYNRRSQYTDGQSFPSLLALFYPTVAGILAGTANVGAMRRPGFSVPFGLFFPVFFSVCVYVLHIFLVGSTFPRNLLKVHRHLHVTPLVSWPHHMVTHVAVMIIGFAEALLALSLAPTLLQALADDRALPFTALLRTAKADEPLTRPAPPVLAVLLAALVAFLTVMGGSLDKVAPVVTMVFLLCFAMINLGCFLLAWHESPKFRPTFPAFHWSVALLGTLWCLVLMVYISWPWAIVGVACAGFVFKVLRFQRGVVDWGEGTRGQVYESSVASLMALDAMQGSHTRSWRPQVLALVRMEDTPPWGERTIGSDRRLLAFVRQLNDGRGLSVFAHVLVGPFGDMVPVSQLARYNMLSAIRDEGLDGFGEVLVSPSLTVGACSLVQTAGLGGLQPNVVLMGFPEHWASRPDAADAVRDVVRLCMDVKKAAMIARGTERFPARAEITSAPIDIWWLMNDGGMLPMVAHLLKRKQEWRLCQVRVFSVARSTDNHIQLKRDLEHLLAETLMIEATVMDPIELPDAAVRPFLSEEEINLRRASGNTQPLGLDDAMAAVALNGLIRSHSARAGLVIVSLPPPEPHPASPARVYCEYIDLLTRDLQRTLMVRACGREALDKAD
jgi:potassium/chloride transporter 4/5/6